MAVALTNGIESAATPLVDHIRRRIALRLLPLLFTLYIVNYLDRTSVAYAAIGMSRDLGFSDRVFGLGAGVFFFSYLVLQIPGALLVERWGARRMISATMIAWGFLTALTALVHIPAQLYLARFLLGAAEASFFPGVILYLSHWFIQEDRAKATSSFMSAVPLSLVIESPIAGWILGRRWIAIDGWRWLFILEGIPAAVLGLVAYFHLTESPREATWLAPEQREWIEGKLREEKPASMQAMSVRQVLISRTNLLLAAAAFLNFSAVYGFIFWFPTMLKRQSGFSDVHVGLLGALPYLACFAAMQANGWHSDKSRERRWHSAAPLLISAAGLMGLAAQPRSIVLSLVFFTMVGVGMAFLAAFWAIPTEILSQAAAAPALGVINAVGNVSGLASPYLFGYLNTRTGSFSSGLSVLALSAFGGALLMLCIPRTARAVVSQQ